MSVRVLYIASVFYTGSTLLGNALGQVDGFFYGGELRNLWRRGLGREPALRVRLPFARCPVCTAALSAAFDREDLDVQAMEKWNASRIAHVT